MLCNPDLNVSTSEEMYRRIVEAIPEGIWVVDSQGFTIFSNLRMADILGTDFESMPEQSCFGCVFPDELEDAQRHFARNLAGDRRPFDFRLRRADGSPIWVSISCMPVYDDAGAPVGLLGLFSDITERKQAEEQRLHLASIVEYSEDAIFSKSLEGTIASWNSGAERVFGYKAEEILGKSVSLLLPPGRFDEFLQILEKIQSGSHPEHFEVTGMRKDGSRVEVSVTISPLKDSAGAVIGSSTIARDITVWKQAEAALQESQLRYKEVFDVTSECIFLLDVTPDARFKFAGFNPAEEKAVGFLSSEVFGKFIEEVVEEQVANGVITNYRRCLEMGTLISYEEELVVPIGRRYFHTKLVPVRNAAGRVYRIVGIARDITEYRQTEEALRLSQQRLELAQEGAGIAAWDWDIVSNQKHCSREYGRLYGLPAGDFGPPHEEWLKLIHPEDRSRVREELSLALEGTARYDTEFRIVWPDGSVHWLFAKGKVIRDSKGKAIRMLGVNMDISERKYADQALRESEKRFRNMADTAPVMMWVTGPDNLFTFVNKTWLNFTGRTMEQELGNGWVAGVHPDDFERCYEAFCRAFDARRNFQLECRLRRSDGEYRSILCSGVPRFAPGHIFAGYIGSNIDVTDLQSEERFRQLAENIDQVFWMLDLSTQLVLYVSPAFEKVWGCSSAALYQDRSWLVERVYAEDRDRFTAFLTKVKSEPVEESYRIVRPDGSVRWIHDRTFPICDPEGKPYRVAGISEDVTAHRELEEQLRQAHKMEAVGRLAGGVAHDFNNLLTVICGYSQILRDGTQEADPRREKLEQILNAANHASILTRQLLAFSRRQVLQPKLVNVNRLLTNMEALLRPIIGEHITIETEFDPKVSCIKVDPHQIEQVVMNLAANARDAMPNGGQFRIRTSVAHASDMHDENSPCGAGKCVLLRISDTGSGMDDRTRERAFEPFFTTKGLGKGTGLGLSTVYGIVRQNQGEIHISSEPGHGTAFDLYFPAVPGNEAESELPANRLSKNRATETILVVEDEPALRGLVRQTLEQLGYTVLEADDGYKALRVIEQYASEIHLLLTDVIMPLMNGHELATRLQSIRPGIKVLYMSGYTDEVLAFHGVARPEIAFIQKPFTSSELAGKVETVLSADGRSESSERTL